MRVVPDSSTTPSRGELYRTRGGSLYVASWMLQRLVVGLLGVAMPVVVIVGEAVLFPSGVVQVPRASLSAYYYSGLRDVFVGTLVVTGVFLITYMAFHWNPDNVITVVAGLAAVGVAVFPTGPDPGEVATPWQHLIGVHRCQVVHYGCALVFIAGLAVMSVRFADREAERANRGRAWLHVGCAVVMACTAVVALILGAVGVRMVDGFSGLLIVELVCTWAFGVSWLVKGLELRAALAEGAP